MTQAVYEAFLENTTALLLLLFSALALWRSWKEGQFLGASLFLGVIVFVCAELLYVWTSRMDFSLWTLGLAAAIFLFTFVVVYPMAMRRARRKKVAR